MPHHETLEAQGDAFDIDVGDEDDDEPEEDEDDEDEEEEGEWQVDGQCARLDFARLKSL
jgi:hypothetical protein